MIIYDLSCDNDHRFEGWFRSADDFASQGEQGLIRCPQCDSMVVRRVPSAVAIGGHHGGEMPREATGATSGNALSATALMTGNTQVMAIYRQLVQAIINNTEDVGSDFAEEARRIYYNEAPERPIRGQATSDERAELQDEGIDILHLPVLNDDELM